MIKITLEYIVDEIKHAIDLNEGDVVIKGLSSLQEKKDNGIVVSLLNVEEEKIFKNDPNYFVDNEKAFFQTPRFSINLDLAIVFDFGEYSTSLQHLSSVANFFHKKKFFSKDRQLEENLFPDGINKFTLDFRNRTIEELNQIWSMSGGVHYPALFYRLRLVQLEQDKAIKGKGIIEIKVNAEKQGKSTQDL